MLAAMRVAVWARQAGRLRDFAVAAYRAAFCEGADLADLAVLAEVARDVGLAGEEVPEAVQDPVVKNALREGTDAAWAAGVRGVPTVRVGDECFWGDDRLEEAARRLRSGTASS
jgi:2-hydroxychromene-2-carboxylate isomerase